MSTNTLNPAARRGPLHGVRIVEFRGIGPAPFAGMLLADMGAEILQVAPPGQAAQMPVPEHKDPIWRGRSRLALDLKQPAARAALLDILPRVDIVIEGFRPGAMERMGLGPEQCLARNPAMVFGRMTGWGQDGPLAQAPSHDPNCLAITGALHSIGSADGAPVPPLNLVGDLGGGALYLAMGVLAALVHARASGQGQVVDAAMVDGVASLMGMVYAMRDHGIWSDQRGVNMLDGSCPFGSAYETADGKYMVAVSLEPPFYQALLKGLGLEQEELPAQYDRAGWPVLRRRFAEVFKTRTRAEWTAILEHANACVSPVLDMGEAVHHPHNQARGVFVGGEHPVPAAAPRFGATPTAHAAADLGPAAALLADWGVGKAEIALIIGSSQ
ncbi:CaiB/BaiF CoA transferase family protein [Pseudoduganella namucuonensis]|uniref:Alpha-methylacyl-CoA racemase n=1 Tax=Pseudoduganella namucuonensis TaxID=1035707 RepID=A0A1I7LE75_9BURK|nr:CaiB/BaiF CoA-transferase family protein [Pseudoduganella namucuonensis]SFV07991.1 alpha-methylacyl-CoA racemase [Pseudoduganella namucuonensis]